MAGRVVSKGQRVEFQCFSWVKFDEFLFIKESGALNPQTPSPTSYGRSLASFSMEVTTSDAGSYECFGRFHKAPYVWSQPSDPWLLQVNGKEAPPPSPGAPETV